MLPKQYFVTEKKIQKSAANKLGMQPAFQKFPFLEYFLDIAMECHGMMQA